MMAASREQMIAQAEDYLKQVLPDTNEQLVPALSKLYVGWWSHFLQKQGEILAKQLNDIDVEVSIAHFTGDSSFSTEYTIKTDACMAVGPTFDLALIEFTEKLLKEIANERTLLKETHALLTEPVLTLADSSPGWHDRRSALLDRLARIIGEDK
jgi:hypothetical protein